jgi:hypothetical protein
MCFVSYGKSGIISQVPCRIYVKIFENEASCGAPKARHSWFKVN